MTQFIQYKTFVAHFFVISSIIIVLTASTKIKSNHYSVWRYDQTTIRSGAGNNNNKSDETTNVTFDVKIRGTTRHENNAWKNQYNLVVKFENVLWFLNNNVNYHRAEDHHEFYGLKLGADGQCTQMYTKSCDNEIDLKRAVTLLLFPESYYKMNEMKKYTKKNGLSDCFEVTPLGHCKTFVQTAHLKDDTTFVVTKHTNADYCDEEQAVFESLTAQARPSISPDSSLDVKYLIDQTDNKLSRVEMSFEINYPSESESVQNKYVLTHKGFEFIDDEEDHNDSDDLASLTVDYS